MEILAYIILSIVILWITYEPKKKEEKRSDKKVTVRLTVKAIIKWEKLTKKPFSQIDESSEEDMTKLLYCMSSMNETLEVFTAALGSKAISKEIVSSFRKEMSLINQFQSEQKEKEKSERYFSEIAGMIIASGVDPNYVLNEMEVYNMDLIIKGIDEKKRQDMSERRLWTYMSILPHVDVKKSGLTAVKMYPFPWEIEELEKQEAEALRKSLNVLNKFSKGEIKFN
ncbi:MAG: hypothetical protein LKI39_02700 [Bacteroides sp.]|jgi:hypothetical protein|nr:hypothetical protein [Bacteroides sp.]